MKTIEETSDRLVLEVPPFILAEPARFTPAHPIVLHWPAMLERDSATTTVGKMPTAHRAFAERVIEYLRDNPTGVVEVIVGST